MYASGIVKSVNQYQVFSNVSGLLDHIFVKEGDTISEGSPLFTIYNENSKLSRENAKLAAEFADFNNNSNRLTELKLNIGISRQKMEEDSINWKRQFNLWKQNIGSKIELEQRELIYKNSKNSFETAVIRYKELERQLRFNAKQAGKQLEISSRFTDDFTILSRTNGKVYSILKEKGEMVNTQTPIAVIGDASKFILELQVDEYDISSIRKGQTVFIRLDSYRDSVFEAVVSKIYPIMNERSKTFTVEAVFVNQSPLLFPNLTVEASIVINTRKNTLTIPRNYLINDSFVVHTDGRKIRVQTGLRDYRKIEILSGISSKDEIQLPEE